MQPFFAPPTGRLPRAAIFLSGSGSNAEKILDRCRQQPGVVEIVALVTDRPRRSRAAEIGATWGVPVIAADIREFYRQHGLDRVTLRSDAGRAVRAAWTDNLRQQLSGLQIDFGLFAGFIPLTNLTGDFPCLNVHPGDLTYLRDGRRYLVGLHTLPITRAVLAGLDSLRSSVIVAEPYTGEGEDMDSGVILGISAPVPIALLGHDPAALRDDETALAAIAEANLERLKINGDWVVFPPVVLDFAAGRFARDDRGDLCFRQDEGWLPVKTVVYGPAGSDPLPRSGC